MSDPLRPASPTKPRLVHRPEVVPDEVATTALSNDELLTLLAVEKSSSGASSAKRRSAVLLPLGLIAWLLDLALGEHLPWWSLHVLSGVLLVGALFYITAPLRRQTREGWA